jgi:hypothetical protein
MVQKQSRLYQESVRTLAELTDTTGVDLCAGQAPGRDRSMVSIRADKVARARTYRRILQVSTPPYVLAMDGVKILLHRFLALFLVRFKPGCISSIYCPTLGALLLSQWLAARVLYCSVSHLS